MGVRSLTVYHTMLKEMNEEGELRVMTVSYAQVLRHERRYLIPCSPPIFYMGNFAAFVATNVFLRDQNSLIFDLCRYGDFIKYVIYVAIVALLDFSSIMRLHYVNVRHVC